MKNNQSSLAEAIDGFFTEAERSDYPGLCPTRAKWVEKDHGRIETRRCVVIDERDWLEERRNWPGLKTLVLVEAIREINGVISTERRYIRS